LQKAQPGGIKAHHPRHDSIQGEALSEASTTPIFRNSREAGPFPSMPSSIFDKYQASIYVSDQPEAGLTLEKQRTSP
jgi:hypothetical protein